MNGFFKLTLLGIIIFLAIVLGIYDVFNLASSLLNNPRQQAQADHAAIQSMQHCKGG